MKKIVGFVALPLLATAGITFASSEASLQLSVGGGQKNCNLEVTNTSSEANSLSYDFQDVAILEYGDECKKYVLTMKSENSGQDSPFQLQNDSDSVAYRVQVGPVGSEILDSGNLNGGQGDFDEDLVADEGEFTVRAKLAGNDNPNSNNFNPVPDSADEDAVTDTLTFEVSSPDLGMG